MSRWSCSGGGGGGGGGGMVGLALQLMPDKVGRSRHSIHSIVALLTRFMAQYQYSRW